MPSGTWIEPAQRTLTGNGGKMTASAARKGWTRAKRRHGLVVLQDSRRISGRMKLIHGQTVLVIGNPHDSASKIPSRMKRVSGRVGSIGEALCAYLLVSQRVMSREAMAVTMADCAELIMLIHIGGELSPTHRV